MRNSTLVCLMLAAGTMLAAQTPPQAAPPTAMRLYVLDCGILNISREGVERYHVTTAEVGETRMPVPCFLVAHPKGTLLWDVGVIPDDDVEKAGAGGARYDVNSTAAAVVTRTLRGQLAALGYRPADITYVAVSHAHKDHTANLNQFATATWLTPPAEREFMWRPNNERVEPRFFSLLEKSKWIPLDKDEYDVFGDGKAIIKAAPGHTPGHQVLVLSLASLGKLMIAGDLYHYPAERGLRRAPPDNEFDVAQSAVSRATIEQYLAATKATILIQHEWAAVAKLKKPPEYYE